MESDLDNLNCHLESADSVRTNPENPFRERHYSRLFAEAFTHILIGEELRFGQTPLYDSHGAVQFFGELLRAWEAFYSERKDDVQIERYSPVVMTHYESIKTVDSRDFVFDVPSDVLLQTFLINTEKPSFISSALPGIGRNRQKLVDYVRRNRFDLGCISQDLLSELKPYELGHLESLNQLDAYFRRFPSNVCRNVKSYFTPLRTAIERSAQHDVSQLSSDARTVMQLYKESLSVLQNYNRSDVYTYLENALGDRGRIELFGPAKEVADSWYMYNEARVSGAVAETTSSGVETNDSAIRELGEELNEFVDSIKMNDQQKGDNSYFLRPVLQLADFDGSPLYNSAYRSRLLKGLASFVASDEFVPLRQNAILELQRGYSYLQEYWQSRLRTAAEHPELKGLIKWHVTSTGAFAIEFFSPAIGSEASLSQHAFGALVPGVEANSDSLDSLREACAQLRVNNATEKNGNSLSIS